MFQKDKGWSVFLRETVSSYDADVTGQESGDRGFVRTLSANKQEILYCIEYQLSFTLRTLLDTLDRTYSTIH